jgi:hypothetical protein
MDDPILTICLSKLIIYGELRNFYEVLRNWDEQINGAIDHLPPKLMTNEGNSKI